VQTYVLAVAMLVVGCGDPVDAGLGPDAGDGEGVDAGVDPDAPGGTPSIEGTPVSSFVSSGCSTSVVLSLSRQIAEEVDCLRPGQLVPFEESPTIDIVGSAVLPYLGSPARTALYAAAAAGGGRIVRVNSAFRTVVQQYLLRRWFELDRCGITAAAQPGGSNHESGRALDIGNYNDWISLLGARGWSHSVPNDPVHFDHTGSPDIRGTDVLAFQRLWNRNAPDDQIAEDGSYGPITAARVQRAPAEGFGIGAICPTARANPRQEIPPWAYEPDVGLDSHAH
jgi:hypothetical protein